MRTRFFTIMLALFAIAMTVGAQVVINETNFPDPNFRKWVREQSYGQDGKLTDDEIRGVKSIWVQQLGIGNLTGIEHFTEVESLRCDSNALDWLDVSANAKLRFLYCNHNRMTSLKLPEFSDSLQILYCDNNYLRGELNLSKYKKLFILGCHKNYLNRLDISGCPKMYILYCHNNWLGTLKMPETREALYQMNCASNNLLVFDLSDCPMLNELCVNDNQLATLNVANCPKLKTLYCNNNIIRGAAMQEFLNSLTAQTELSNLMIVDLDNAFGPERNEVTRNQAAYSKSKNWRMLAYKNGSWGNELLGNTTGIEINETKFS